MDSSQRQFIWRVGIHFAPFCSDEDANDTREEEESPDSECSVDKEELVLELVGCKG